MSLNDEEKKMVIAYRLDKANKTLYEAQKVIELSLWATAANRLYYAVERICTHCFDGSSFGQ